MDSPRDSSKPLRPPSSDAASVIEALSIASVLVGADDGIVAANSAACRLLAARPGKNFNDLELSALAPGLRAALDDVRRGGSPRVLRDVVGRLAGRDVHLELTLTPLAAGARPAGAVLLTALDHSELRGLRSQHDALVGQHAVLLNERAASDEELRTLNEALKAANEDLRIQVQELAAAQEADARKNQFLAMLAHELRNPLAAAVNALHIIRTAASTDRQIQQAVRIADRQLRHEARLLDDLLDISRIVLGKVTVQREPVDLRDCLRTAMEAASFAVNSRALRLDVDIPDVPLVVVGDATRLAQCVGNLLSNAVKFTAPGGTVTVSARREDGQAVVVVSDSGVGIEPEMLDRVFDLFVQGDGSLGRSQGGLGIGLTLVRRLVELHGGTVTAFSAGANCGSRFEIRLPLSQRTVEATRPPSRSPSRPRRILLVEDNRDSRETLRAVLEQQGHTVSDTGDGTTAIRMAAELVPEVVILDIGLPGVDGFETAGRIRRRLGEHVRIVAVSGYGDGDARQRGRQAGFDAHLVKPVSPDVLLATIDAL